MFLKDSRDAEEHRPTHWKNKSTFLLPSGRPAGSAVTPGPGIQGGEPSAYLQPPDLLLSPPDLLLSLEGVPPRCPLPSASLTQESQSITGAFQSNLDYGQHVDQVVERVGC